MSRLSISACPVPPAAAPREQGVTKPPLNADLKLPALMSSGFI